MPHESTAPTRIAAIDVGTNTALLIVADVSDGTVNVVLDEHTIPRLGEGVYIDGMIRPEAVERVVATLHHYISLIKGASVSTAVAVATAALRNAANRRDVEQRLAHVLGDIPLHVIDGSLEADITYAGVVGKDATSGIIDIGGGSTEIVWPTSAGTRSRMSLDVGAVRLMDAWTSGTVPYGSVVVDLALPKSTDAIWFGVAGTPVALAMLEQGLSTYEAGRVEGFVLTLDRIRYWSNALVNKTLPPSLIESIPSGRADILPAGATILSILMHEMNMPQITVSTRGLRHGVLQWMVERLPPFTS